MSKQDPLKSLKYMGYCLSLSPPNSVFTFEDLVRNAKFFLCHKTGRLTKDSVWEQYTDEEILVEYYAHIFRENERARSTFEAESGLSAEMNNDIYSWLDNMVAKNQAEMRAELEELPESISFKPGELSGEQDEYVT